MVKPHGKNNGGYFGETIRISDVLERTLAAAELHGWRVEFFPGAGELPLYGLRRLAKRDRLSVYISTGIHGDEPGGPVALAGMLASLKDDKRRPRSITTASKMKKIRKLRF